MGVFWCILVGWAGSNGPNSYHPPDSPLPAANPLNSSTNSTHPGSSTQRNLCASRFHRSNSAYWSSRSLTPFIA